MIVAFMTTKNGLDYVTAQYQGKTFKASDRHGAVFGLCRKLVTAQIPDVSMAVLPRGGGPELFRVPSVHFAATKTIVDGVHGETLTDYRRGPTARRTSKHLDRAAVSFSALTDCVVAVDAVTSPLMLAHHGVGRKESKATPPVGRGSFGDRLRRSASRGNVPNTVSEVL